jgi:hypothetical protein
MEHYVISTPKHAFEPHKGKEKLARAQKKCCRCHLICRNDEKSDEDCYGYMINKF